MDLLASAEDSRITVRPEADSFSGMRGERDIVRTGHRKNEGGRWRGRGKREKKKENERKRKIKERESRKEIQ